MKRGLLPFAFLLLAILGCGGAGAGIGNIAGVVLDQNGSPVRGARVFVEGSTPRETLSNSAGSFLLTDVSAEDLIVKATIGSPVQFYGENMSRVFDTNQSNNATIIMAPIGMLGSFKGTVFAPGGIRVQGARISVKRTDNTSFSSAQVIANDNGDYQINGLHGGKSYQIIASFPGYASAELLRTATAGATQTLNFSLSNNGDPLLPAPANLIATAWTSPLEITRGPSQSRAYAAVKKLIDPRYKESATSRTTATGRPVEVQLFWDKFDSLQLLGYGIWRKRSSDDWVDIDFLRDPLAETYTDSYTDLRDGVQFSYSVSANNTNYPNTTNSESDFSSVVAVTPIGDMITLTPQIVGGNTVRFRWNALSGAANYTVYVFEEYPDYGVTSYDNNFANPATGTSWNYNLTPLSSGHTYYYIVMAANSDDSARSLSTIGSFVAP